MDDSYMQLLMQLQLAQQQLQFQQAPASGNDTSAAFQMLAASSSNANANAYANANANAYANANANARRPPPQKSPEWMAAASAIKPITPPTPPWLKAASVSAAKGRVRIQQTRIKGKVMQWLGKAGWIKPEEKIEHPGLSEEAAAKVTFSEAEVKPTGLDLSVGEDVTCFVCMDNFGNLVAEGVMQYKGTLMGVVGTGPSAPSTSTKVLKPALKQAWTGDFAKMLAAKSWQKKNKLPRKRLTEGASMLGTCVGWNDGYGWLEPEMPIEHPSASKKGGHLYVHQDDILGGGKLSVGQQVNFHVYEDKSGLGAEECIRC